MNNFEYEKWAERYHRSRAILLPAGMYEACEKSFAAARAMVDAFPNLEFVEGEVQIGDAVYAHHWCETAEKEIVDPSATIRFGVVDTILYRPKRR